MARTKIIKEETTEEIVQTIENVQSPFARLLENYKIQNPKKYELKKQELLKKLELNK